MSLLWLWSVLRVVQGSLMRFDITGYSGAKQRFWRKCVEKWIGIILERQNLTNLKWINRQVVNLKNNFIYFFVILRLKHNVITQCHHNIYCQNYSVFWQNATSYKLLRMDPRAWFIILLHCRWISFFSEVCFYLYQINRGSFSSKHWSTTEFTDFIYLWLCLLVSVWVSCSEAKQRYGRICGKDRRQYVKNELLVTPLVLFDCH